jgi:hypothetical protein
MTLLDIYHSQLVLIDKFIEGKVGKTGRTYKLIAQIARRLQISQMAIHDIGRTSHQQPRVVQNTSSTI